MVIHIDEEDFRSVEAFDHEGIALGTLSAQGHYRHTKHTRSMRKVINGLYRSGKVTCDFGGDLVEAYHSHLQQKAEETAKKAPKKINAAATQLAKASYVTGLPTTHEKKKSKSHEVTMLPHYAMPGGDRDWSQVH